MVEIEYGEGEESGTVGAVQLESLLSEGGPSCSGVGYLLRLVQNLFL